MRVSFEKFMAGATREYYSKRDRFGRDGDFYTAEQLPIFGESVARYVRSLGARGKEFQICELGAGRRELAAALNQWTYIGTDLDKDVPRAESDLVIANEFFDALPVRVLRRTGSSWRELLVNESHFVADTAELDENAAAYVTRYGRDVDVLEYCAQMPEWFRNVSTSRWLIIDYGYEATELKRFPQGTLMSYKRHRAFDDVLRNPGEQDITAHVNFSELERVAGVHGFRAAWKGTLQRWMLKIWSEESLRGMPPSTLLQWKLLTFEMGETFRVLELTRA